MQNILKISYNNIFKISGKTKLKKKSTLEYTLVYAFFGYISYGTLIFNNQFYILSCYIACARSNSCYMCYTYDVTLKIILVYKKHSLKYYTYLKTYKISASIIHKTI